LLGRLLVNGQFARLWMAGAVSSVGDVVFDTTVLLWIATVLAKGESWAPAAASGVLIAVLVPTIVVGPLAGVYVDRWDTRRTMLWADAIRALLIGSLVALPLLPHGVLPVTAQLVMVYAVIVVNTIVSQFFAPARFTINADIVPESDQTRAAGITQSTSAAAGIVGPPLAAPLLFTAGVEWALLLNALSFVFSYVMIRSVRTPEVRARTPAAGERTRFWEEFRDGLRTIVRSRVVLAMLITAVLANIGVQVFNALGLFFVVVNLHTPARFFGLQDTFLGSGVIAGAAAAAWLGARFGPARTMWLSLLLFGLVFGVYARLSSFPVALGVLLLAGILLGAMNTTVSPVLLRAVPREVLGRVFATFIPSIRSLGIVGVAVAGWLSSSVLHGLDASVLGVHFGTYDTIFLAAAAVVVIAGVYGGFALRGVDAAS
jgi:MFS family permease